MKLEVQNIHKQFVKHKALDDVSFEVKPQTVFGLLGPNGAGKTTILRIINQIIKPDSGKIFLDKKNLTETDVYRIGYLPEERGLYKKMKVGEQSIYLSRLKGMTKSDALKKLRFWFDKFEMMSWWNKKVEELSKGMQQKLQFITTIIHEPEILIFDEPFSGFDPINTEIIKNEIQAIREKGATVIFSTHNMSSVEEICDDIVLINNSRKILEGNVNKLRKEFKQNQFMLEYRGIIKNGLFENDDIIVEKNEYDENGGKLQLKTNMDNPQRFILSNLINKVEIVSFYEKFPSINEIFIMSVEHDKGKNHE